MLSAVDNGERFELSSPTSMPKSAGFLWNRQMMLQVNCRGYAVSMFMQPEPAKYMHAPNLEAKTFMQPEQPHYTHHPGRFFYIKDEETQELFSAPYEPVRQSHDRYCFSVGKSDIKWYIEHLGIRIQITLSLTTDDVVELWQVEITNISGRSRRISLYPYFPVGYMSWMNQSAEYREDLNALVASCVTPYQKYTDYFKNKFFKDKTFLIHDRTPAAYECNREAFEGEGGLHRPDSVMREALGDGDARYEPPVAALQYRLEIPSEQSEKFRFILGPAFDDAEIKKIRDRYLPDTDFARAREQYREYIHQGQGVIEIETPDDHFNHFVNHWLPRQIFYHGDSNRLSTDPQTRNYLQDNMGMVYVDPDAARAAFVHALSQQEDSGAMPDGILMLPDAELKYINQIPHTDHCVWLPVCLKAYFDETNDYGLLDEIVRHHKTGEALTVMQRITRAMRWMLSARDERGLSYIAQGDWCDPMNMVGYKGKGVSGWLSVASAYALHLWADICARLDLNDLVAEFRSGANDFNRAVNEHLWDGNWYGRGITDDGVIFGVAKDQEGRIFLNPQSWAILAGTADKKQRDSLIKAVESQLETPYGVMMLAPAYTGMREDVGRVTQKHPGSAENGSVYNHAAIFYIYSLYTAGDADRAWRLLRQMLPGPDYGDYLQRGQLPVFIPNYYRGAYYQFPRTAGRSSHLFNTGTVSWVYRSIIDGLFGLRGDGGGLRLEPQLPAHWQSAKAIRCFRGAIFDVRITRAADVTAMEVTVDGRKLVRPHIADIQANQVYQVEIRLPRQ